MKHPALSLMAAAAVLVAAVPVSAQQPEFNRGDLVRVADAGPCLRVIAVPGDASLEFGSNGGIIVNRRDRGNGFALPVRILMSTTDRAVFKPGATLTADTVREIAPAFSKHKTSDYLSGSYMTVMTDGTAFRQTDYAGFVGGMPQNPMTTRSLLRMYGGKSLSFAFPNGWDRYALAPQDYFDAPAVEAAFDVSVTKQDDATVTRLSLHQYEASDLKLCERYKLPDPAIEAAGMLGPLPGAFFTGDMKGVLDNIQEMFGDKDP